MLPADLALSDLGRHRLKDIGVVRLWQLDVDGLPTRFGPPRTLEAHPTNLPVEVTTLVDRGSEADDLESRVVDGPLVTVTGTGGIGKSRLALSVARRLVPAFPDGVFYLDLASLDRVETAVAELATLTDARMSPGDDPRRCSWPTCATGAPCWSSRPPTDRRASRRSSDGSSRTARPRDSSSPRDPRSIFVPSGSSRSNPSRSRRAGAGLEDALASPAVALFARPGARGQSGVRADRGERRGGRGDRPSPGRPSPRDRARRRGDPAPVAGGILTRLERSLPLPGGATVDAPERQRTIHDTVAWSYMLLDPPSGRCSPALSVFAGAFDLDGVMALAPPRPIRRRRRPTMSRPSPG